MTNSARCFSTAAVLMAAMTVMGGCESGGPALPMAPEVQPQAAVTVSPISSFVLTGVVFEMTASGRAPVAGVELYCDSCGSPNGHTFVTSDGEGQYRFEWSSTGIHQLQVWKDGYALAHSDGNYGTIEYVEAIVMADTEFDVEMVRQ